MRMFNPFAAVPLAAGALAVCGALNPALAGPPPADDTMGPITELQDGTLAAYRPDGVAAMRYAHQPQLVAGSCIALEARRSAANDSAQVLANHCAYAVAVSWCIDGREAGERACERIGHRRIESLRIEPGAALKLEGAARLGDAEVEWIGCRAEAAAVSLIDNGTRGECLGPQAGSQLATRSAASPGSK